MHEEVHAMQVGSSVVLRVHTIIASPDYSKSPSEALTTIPNAVIREICDENGELIGREICQN